jgi:hypothetical protein
MFKKIRDKWKKRIKYVKARDIESCRKHPKLWIGAMIILPFYFIALSIILISKDTTIIIMILIFSIFIYYIEKQIFNTYKKAFPKN